MKTSLFLGSALAVLLATTAASAATKTFTVTLNGAQENPPVTTTTATGSGTLTFDDSDNSLKGTITFQNLSNASAAHIHKAPCGSNAGVVHALTASNTSITVAWTGMSAADITALNAHELYVNIHTSAHNTGEIRGQILVQGTTATCPPGAGDGGTEAGSSTSSSGGSSSGGSSSGGSSSGGSSGASSSGGSSSGGSSGASTTRPDSGTTGNAAPAEDDGCSTTGGSAPSNGLVLALGVGIALAGVARARNKKR